MEGPFRGERHVSENDITGNGLNDSRRFFGETAEVPAAQQRGIQSSSKMAEQYDWC